MDPVLILTAFLILTLCGMALPRSLKEKSIKDFLLGALFSFLGILLPVGFFFLSALLVPDSRDNCFHGWLDCFHLGKLAMTPFVIWASAALYAVEVYQVKDRTRPWIVLGFFGGAIVSTLCAIYGFLTSIDGLILLGVPIYTAIWYVVRTVQLVRAANTSFFSLLITAASSVPFWAVGVFASYFKYATLPQHPPDCFVVTAASRGHLGFVGPFHSVQRRGHTRIVNQQLITLWQFEALWRRRVPRVHAAFRRAYNVLGPLVARRINRPWMADICYLTIKPFELCARILNTLCKSPL
ncbi:MAG TPA: DUF6688 family protein [Verrucomicrobiae bacterium]|jgi:hypothetical protein|nr:DUF6688 family protein [Verrucomicrobiae bacterium]